MKLSNPEVLRAMGIPFAMHDRSLNSECQESNLGACSIDNFIVDKGRGLGYFVALGGKTIKEIMELQIRKEVKRLVELLKSEG